MTIAELNSRITVKNYTTTQDETTGKVSASLTASWSKWAKVEQTSDSRILDNAAVTYRNTYKITVRFETSRPTLSKYNIVYNGDEMKIYSSVPQKIGNRWWEEIICYNQ